VVGIAVLRIDKQDLAIFARILIPEHDARVHGHDIAGDTLCRHDFRTFQLIRESFRRVAIPGISAERYQPLQALVVRRGNHDVAGPVNSIGISIGIWFGLFNIG